MLIFIHGWMGVAVCLPFAMWFASAIVMMYSDFPAVSQMDRLNHANALNAVNIGLSPPEAFGKLHEKEPPEGTRLITLDQRPAYAFQLSGHTRYIYADNGEEQSQFSTNLTLRVASAWTNQPPADALMKVNTEEDQWTISGQFRRLGPLRKYTWPDGEEVYVSTITGEVVQYTTRASRIAAYFGAIPHWLYFTPLRRRAHSWSHVVVWLSGGGTIAVFLGLVIGTWVYSPSRKYVRDGAAVHFPYIGQKRWHLTLGLTFGCFACTWAFSGMLSMDPFPALQEGNGDQVAAQIDGDLRSEPLSLEAFMTKSPQQALLQLDTTFKAKELEFASFDGKPLYIAHGTADATRIVPFDEAPMREFTSEQIIAAALRAIAPNRFTQTRLVSRYDAYYLDRNNRLPLPVLYLQLNDSDETSVYIDLKTAHVVEEYDARSRANRWLYHGLHSLNFPWLYAHRPLWDIAVLLLLIGGEALSITALVLAYRLIKPIH